MKRAVTYSIVFIITFLLTLVAKFPYASLLSYICYNIGNENDLNIVWTKQITSFPTIKLYEVRIVASESEIASFDRLDLVFSLGAIRFKGQKESCKINGKLKPPFIIYNIYNLPIPEQLQKSLGKGVLNTSGEYNYKQKKGKGKFDATIAEFPNPLITGTVAIGGDTSLEPNKSDLSFNLKGNNLEGKGTLTFSYKDPKSPTQIGGLLDLKVNSMPVMLNISGDINNPSISNVR